MKYHFIFFYVNVCNLIANWLELLSVGGIVENIFSLLSLSELASFFIIYTKYITSFTLDTHKIHKTHFSHRPRT